MSKTGSQERKMVKTYLDELPKGDEAFIQAEEKKSRKERKILPEGCRDSVLYRDVMRRAAKR